MGKHKRRPVPAMEPRYKPEQEQFDELRYMVQARENVKKQQDIAIHRMMARKSAWLLTTPPSMLSDKELADVVDILQVAIVREIADVEQRTLYTARLTCIQYERAMRQEMARRRAAEKAAEQTKDTAEEAAR